MPHHRHPALTCATLCLSLLAANLGAAAAPPPPDPLLPIPPPPPPPSASRGSNSDTSDTTTEEAPRIPQPPPLGTVPAPSSPLEGALLGRELAPSGEVGVAGGAANEGVLLDGEGSDPLTPGLQPNGSSGVGDDRRGGNATVSATVTLAPGFPSAETKELLRLSTLLVDAAGGASVAAFLLGGGGLSAVSISRHALVLRSAECEWASEMPYIMHPLRFTIEGNAVRGIAASNVALCAGVWLALLALTKASSGRLAPYLHFPGVPIALMAFLAPPTLAAGVQLLLVDSADSLGYGVVGVAPTAVFYLAALLFFPAETDSVAVRELRPAERNCALRYVMGHAVWQSAPGGTHLQRTGLLFRDYDEMPWVCGRYIVLESVSAIAVGIGSGLGYVERTHESCMATNLVLVVALTVQLLSQIVNGLYISRFLTHVSDAMLVASVAGLVGITAYETGPEVESAGAWLLFAASIFCVVHAAHTLVRLAWRLLGAEPEVAAEDNGSFDDDEGPSPFLPPSSTNTPRVPSGNTAGVLEWVGPAALQPRGSLPLRPLQASSSGGGEEGEEGDAGVGPQRGAGSELRGGSFSGAGSELRGGTFSAAAAAAAAAPCPDSDSDGESDSNSGTQKVWRVHSPGRQALSRGRPNLAKALGLGLAKSTKSDADSYTLSLLEHSDRDEERHILPPAGLGTAPAGGSYHPVLHGSSSAQSLPLQKPRRDASILSTRSALLKPVPCEL